MIHRKGLALVLGTLCAVLAAFSAAAQQTKANIGYIGAADFVPLFVAKDKGIFDKRGLDATLTRIQIAPNVASAIVSGDLQIGMGTVPVLLHTAEGGLGLVAIAGASRFRKDNSIASLVARPGASIKTASDLRGKKVGVPGLNSMMHEVLEKWLINNKVPRGEVTMVETVFPQMKDMLKSGTIDAAISIEPFRSRILSDGTGIKVADYITEVQDNMLAVIWMAKGEWAAANPQAVKAFLQAYAEAIDWCAKNPAEAKIIEAKYLGAASPVVANYSLELGAKDLEFFQNIGLELGLLRARLDVNKLIWGK